MSMRFPRAPRTNPATAGIDLNFSQHAKPRPKVEILFENNKHFCDSEELDSDHPERWGKAIMAKLFEKALEK